MKQQHQDPFINEILNALDTPETLLIDGEIVYPYAYYSYYGEPLLLGHITNGVRYNSKISELKDVKRTGGEFLPDKVFTEYELFVQTDPIISEHTKGIHIYRKARGL